MSDALIKIATFYNQFDAQIAKSKLESENIFCYLQDENSIFGLQTVSYLARLFINESDREVVLSILQDNDEIDISNIEIHKEDKYSKNDKLICTKCNSTNVYFYKTQSEFGQVLNSFTKYGLIFLILFLKKRHHCFNCKYEWD